MKRNVRRSTTPSTAYDKLMAAIGSTGSNAYTWYDQTVYQEDIPSNQIENWAKIQADRFENNVIRGFHTELEAVYEEKNMSLTRDNSKVQEAIFSSLFPKHPYGMVCAQQYGNLYVWRSRPGCNNCINR